MKELRLQEGVIVGERPHRTGAKNKVYVRDP
jgi:hypothetical protein